MKLICGRDSYPATPLFIGFGKPPFQCPTEHSGGGISPFLKGFLNRSQSGVKVLGMTKKPGGYMTNCSALDVILRSETTKDLFISMMR